MVIYYDSRTGNVFRFINKLKKVFQEYDIPVEFIKLNNSTNAEEKGHLITYTDGFGQISKVTQSFLERDQNASKILTVSSSGNMNWGENYAKAASLISEKFDIPIALRFELSGTQSDALNYYKRVMEL